MRVQISAYTRASGGRLKRSKAHVLGDGSIIFEDHLMLPEREVRMFGRNLHTYKSHDGSTRIMVNQAHGIGRRQLISLGGRWWHGPNFSRIYFDMVDELLGDRYAGDILYMDPETGSFNGTLTEPEIAIAIDQLIMLANDYGLEA